MGSIYRPPKAVPPTGSSDRPSIHRCERSSPVRNRKLEICTSGSVRGEDGNILTYSATVRGREGEFEAAGGLLCKPGLGLLGDVCRMIVEDQLDRGMARIGGIDKLKEFDELAAAMAVPDQGVNLTAQQIDAGQQADGALTFVFMIARRSGVCQARAAGPARSSQSPGYLASHHRR